MRAEDFIHPSHYQRSLVPLLKRLREMAACTALSLNEPRPLALAWLQAKALHSLTSQILAMDIPRDDQVRVTIKLSRPDEESYAEAYSVDPSFYAPDSPAELDGL